MFDENLRGKLADPSLLPPIRVGQSSANIKLQHTLSLLLYKRSLEGKPTFLTGEEYLRSKQAVINAVKEITSELNEDLLDFNAKVGLFDDKDMLKSQIDELRILLSTIVNISKDVSQSDFSQIKEKWDKILTDLENNAKIIRQTLQKISSLKTIFEKIQDLDRKVTSELESLRRLLRQAYRLCSKLYSVARSSYHAEDKSLIQRWYKVNSGDVEMVAKETPDSDEILSRLYTPFFAYFTNVMKGDYRAFRVKYGFGFDEVVKTLTDVTTSLGSRTESGLANFLKELPNMAKFLQSVNLQGLIIYESLNRIENELKVKPWGIDIIDAINLLLLNRTKFSLLLEPPSPELQLVGVEGA